MGFNSGFKGLNAELGGTCSYHCALNDETAEACRGPFTVKKRNSTELIGLGIVSPIPFILSCYVFS